MLMIDRAALAKLRSFRASPVVFRAAPDQERPLRLPFTMTYPSARALSEINLKARAPTLASMRRDASSRRSVVEGELNHPGVSQLLAWMM